MLQVIGDPVLHSKSPIIQSTMLDYLGLDIPYTPHLVKKGEVPQYLAFAETHGVTGFNATMPHKLHLLDLVDEKTEEAVYFGAINTVRNDKGRLIGHNTDGDGFANMLAEHGLTFRNARVAVLGAGGAAGAIIRKAVQDGAASVTICNRTVEKARSLCMEHPDVLHAAALDTPLPGDTNLLINTIPVGGNVGGDVLANLRRDCAVIDILYAPPKTPLLLAAEERGMLAANGLGMLIHQAILAFAFFTGASFDQPEMARILYKTTCNLTKSGVVSS